MTPESELSARSGKVAHLDNNNNQSISRIESGREYHQYAANEDLLISDIQ